jgi:hypothetical protein
MSTPGKWNLHFNFGCSGAYFPATLTFNANNTFTDNFNQSGKWAQTNGNILWRYDQAPNTIYAGSINGGAILGAMSNFGSGGCFYADKSGGAALLEGVKAAEQNVGPNYNPVK